MSRVPIIRGVVVPVFLSLIPGWGHLWMHRYWRGFLLFTMFFGSLNTWMMADFFQHQLASLAWSRIWLALALSIAVFSLADVLRMTLWSRSKSVQIRRRQLLKRAVLHWIRSENGQAEEVINKVLRIDPNDPVALVWAGTIDADGGRHKSAKQYFARALRADDEEKWSTGIRLELQQLRIKK